MLSAGQATLKSRGCYGTVTCPHLSLKGVALLTAPWKFDQNELPVIILKNILHCAAGRHRTITEGKVGDERDSGLGP